MMTSNMVRWSLMSSLYRNKNDLGYFETVRWEFSQQFVNITQNITRWFYGRILRKF